MEKNKKRVVIIGTSTTAKTVSAFIEYYGLFDILGFAVNKQYLQKSTFCDKPVFAIEELTKVINKSEDLLFVAIQWNKLNADRRKVYETLKQDGYQFANIISPSAVIHGKLLGDNCWVGDNAVIDFGSTVGSDCFIKNQAYISYNNKIGDHCFIGAKSLIAGSCQIGEQCFVGLNATVFDCTTVGNKCIVGACTAVKRNMPDFSKISTASDSYKFKQYAENEVEEKLMFSKNVRKLSN